MDVRSYFARWLDVYGVVHWVMGRRHAREYTACLIVVEYYVVEGPLGTRLPPTCLHCIIDAEDEVAGYRDP